MPAIAVIEGKLEFIASINEAKDCLMSQDTTQTDPAALWFNIDILKGHGLKAGDRIRITLEKMDAQ